MTGAILFPYSAAGPFGQRRAIIPLSLRAGTNTVSVNGLVDSGSMLSLFPHSVGAALGLDWTTAFVLPPIGGNIGRFEYRAAQVLGTVAGFQPVVLAFAWCESDAVPTLLGQTNFFDHFDVCFFQAKCEIRLSRSTP